MKRDILSVLALILSLCISASATSLDQIADSAYTADNFEEAAAMYQKAIEQDGSSSTIYYNLGNCFYRLGKPGKAIVAYERALRLDPANSDTRANLEFVNERITDRRGDSGSFLSNSLDKITQSAPANSWAWISFASFLLLLGAIALYVFSSGVMLRKVGFFGGIVLIILTILFVIVAFRASEKATSETEAIITVPSTILSTSPREPKNRTEEAMLLHEGTKLEILDSVSTRTDSTQVKWYDVQIDNHHRAWIKASDIEII